MEQHNVKCMFCVVMSQLLPDNIIGLLLRAGASNFTEAMKMGSEIYHHLKSVIKAKYGQDGKSFIVCVAGVSKCVSEQWHNGTSAQKSIVIPAFILFIHIMSLNSRHYV